MDAKKKKNLRLRKKRHWLWRMPLSFWVIFIVIAFFGLNFVVQVVRKPTEIIGLLDQKFHKSIDETWNSYAGTFIEKSTPVMTPDLLAALAQAESNGNPIVRTYWKWRWTTDFDRLFAPASSAVGMFQITEGTFEEARKFCVREGRAYRDEGFEGDCLGNELYSRLIPSHAIEMTSARLHYLTEKMVSESKRRARHQDKQNTAIVIHLCGAAKGRRFVREGFNPARLGRCGDHRVSQYIQRVRNLQASFKRRLEQIEAAQVMAASEEI